MSCKHEVGPGYQDPPEPPEQCGEDVVDTTDHCPAHLPLHDPDLAHALIEADLNDLIHDIWEQQ